MRQQDLLEECLQTAAERLGDIAPQVLARLHAAEPQLPEVFSSYTTDRQHELQTTMVDQALYCLLTWYERPDEVRIVLESTVPHHVQTLGVSAELFAGLLSTVVAVISEAQDEQAVDRRKLLSELDASLNEIICSDTSAQGTT